MSDPAAEKKASWCRTQIFAFWVTATCDRQTDDRRWCCKTDILSDKTAHWFNRTINCLPPRSDLSPVNRSVGLQTSLSLPHSDTQPARPGDHHQQPHHHGLCDVSVTGAASPLCNKSLTSRTPTILSLSAARTWVSANLWSRLLYSNHGLNRLDLHYVIT